MIITRLIRSSNDNVDKLEIYVDVVADGAMPMDDHSSHNHTQKKSVGIIDIGGASLQIAYEVSSEKSGTNVSNTMNHTQFI